MHKKYLLFLFALFILQSIPLVYGENSKAFMGDHYENIQWTEHLPNGPTDTQVIDRGQIDIGKIDIDRDGREETLKVTWGQGEFSKSLLIQIYKDEKMTELMAEFRPLYGVQPNFKFEDLDGDGKLEAVIWGEIWDPRLPGDEGVSKETSEGARAPHRYIVTTHKLIKGKYMVWDVYTTKKKYDPFFVWNRKGLPE